MVKVVVINGYPGSGKDTFVEYVNEAKRNHIGVNAVLIRNIHTSDLVKNALRSFGYTDEQKYPDVRKLLSDMKEVTSKYWDSSFRYVAEIVNHHKNKNFESIDIIIFVHTREPDEIKRFKHSFNTLTLLINREEAAIQEFSNSSDDNVMNYQYDLIIHNNSTLDELRDRAQDFLKEIVNDSSWNRMINREEG